MPVGFDWIQLTSGEWLKGDLKIYNRDKLEFDSDELKLQIFDLEDIQQVRTYKRYSVRLRGRKKYVGLLKIIGDKVFITTRTEDLVFNRDQLVSVAEGEPAEINYWSAEITQGINIRRGNTDQTSYNASANAKRRTSGSRFLIEYIGIIDESDGKETANSHRLSSSFDVLKTWRFFLRPVFGEYFHDPYSNIRNRATIGTAIGYRLIDTPRSSWDVTPGLAYLYNENVSVETGADAYILTPAIVMGTEYELEVTDDIDFDASYRLYIMNKESGSYTHHATTSMAFELTKRLNFDFSVVWDRIKEPKSKSDGTVPAQDDLYFFFGISFEL